MRAQEPASNGDWKDVPDDYGDEAPETLDMEPGETIEGTLGRIFQGKKDGSYYRILATDDGRYFLGGADLQSLMQYPQGTRVRLTYKGTLDTGKGNPMKKYRKQVQDSDLPF